MLKINKPIVFLVLSGLIFAGVLTYILSYEITNIVFFSMIEEPNNPDLLKGVKKTSLVTYNRWGYEEIIFQGDPNDRVKKITYVKEFIVDPNTVGLTSEKDTNGQIIKVVYYKKFIVDSNDLWRERYKEVKEEIKKR